MMKLKKRLSLTEEATGFKVQKLTEDVPGSASTAEANAQRFGVREWARNQDRTESRTGGKILVAFDLDNTIIDGVSDHQVAKLVPGGRVPDHITSLFSSTGWILYMRAIFLHLHKHSVSSEAILNCLTEIPILPGMQDLFRYLSADRFHVVIISDCNCLFVETILRAAGMYDMVNAVYSNPANFNDDGYLELEEYHTQNWCELSTRNLCKGHILDEHIEEQKRRGVTYDMIAYAGDGSKDMCPCLRLKRPSDLVLPRVGFPLMQQLSEAGMRTKVAGKVIPWSDGNDILSALQSAVAQLSKP